MPTTSDNFPIAFGWFFCFLWLTISLSSPMSFLVFVLLHFGHDQVSLTDTNPIFILNILWILYELIFVCATLVDIHRESKYHSSRGQKPTSASVFTHSITQDVWLTSLGFHNVHPSRVLPHNLQVLASTIYTQCPVTHITNHNPLMPSSLNSSQLQSSFTTILKDGDIWGEGAYLTYIPIYNILALFMKSS